MGQGGGAVKVVKGSRGLKSTFWTHFRRELHLVEHITLHIEAGGHFE